MREKVIILTTIILTLFAAIAYDRGQLFVSNEVLWTDSLKNDFHNMFAHVQIANTYWRTGRLDPAKEHLEYARRVNPGHPLVLRNIAWVTALRGDMARAKEQAKFIEEIFGPDPITRQIKRASSIQIERR
jgi:hypothetical protein